MRTLGKTRGFVSLLVSICLYCIFTLFRDWLLTLVKFKLWWLLFLFEFEHFFQTCLSDLGWGNVVLVHHFVLHWLDLLVWHGWRSKCEVRFLLSASGRCLIACIQQTSFFIDVTEVGQSIEGHDLVHVVNTLCEIQVSLYGNNLTVSWLLSTYHIIFIARSGILAKFSLNDKRKRVWDLWLAGENFSN